MRKLSPFSRRDMLKAGGAAAFMAAGALLLPGAAFAKAPRKHTQVPGYFRFNLGEFEITILSDGNLVLPLGFEAGNVPEPQLKAYLKSQFLSTYDHYSHINLALINTGDHVVLIDTGAGLNFQSSAGKLLPNLEASGYRAEDIDKIILTHCHPDHLLGVIDDFEETAQFPNAEYYINGSELDFWIAEDAASKLPDNFKGFALGARRTLLPIRSKTHRVKNDEEIVPGISMIDSFGHTLGHMSVMAQSASEKLLITSDAVHHANISLEHPDWVPTVDMDAKQSIATRRRLLEMAVTDRFMVVGYHFPFPGVGHIVRAGNVYRWIPATWQWEIE